MIAFAGNNYGDKDGVIILQLLIIKEIIAFAIKLSKSQIEWELPQGFKSCHQLPIHFLLITFT